MAERLASIFGTEKDKVNCPFYFKIGACRHGERCSRLHNKPTLSQTILLKNLYHYDGPAALPTDDPELVREKEREAQGHFEDFYEDIFTEVSKFGEIDDMHVCHNICDHLYGNVYIKFRSEDDAEAALQGLTGRFYARRPILAEFSPVSDFKESSCRQYEMGECTRGGYCNFMHVRPISRRLRKDLYGYSRSHKRRYRSRSPDYDRRSHRKRTRSRSRSPRRRSRSRSRDRSDRHHRSSHRRRFVVS
ncbi:Splicing factor U2af 38 kDa subunit [Balamuthia mandrillaris]